MRSPGALWESARDRPLSALNRKRRLLIVVVALLLVPSYGGRVTALAARSRSAIRAATVMHLAGDGTGDLQVQAPVEMSGG